MIDNSKIQAALMTRLKGDATLVAKLSSSGDIKEAQWQGSQFVYPAVRVKLGTQTPQPGDSCNSNIPFTVSCFEENASSKKADELAGAVVALLHGACWCDIIQGVRFISVRTTGLVSAVREDATTWKSEANFQAIVASSVMAP